MAKKTLLTRAKVSRDANYIIYQNLSNNGLFAGSTYKGDLGNFAIHTAQGITDIEMAQSGRKQLLIDSGFDHVITLKQVHSDVIHTVNHDNAALYSQNQLLEGDGLLTDFRHVLIGVLTADCAPVLITDRNRTFCGIAHAGWKGLKKKIHVKLVSQALKNYAVRPEDLLVLIGPHIRDCCYEVKRDVIGKLKTKAYRFQRPRYFLDMQSVILGDLKKLNLKPSQVFSYPVCTRCGKNPEFFSYRKGDVKERFLSFIGLI